MLLCSWKRFYASFDRSVQQESSYAAGNGFTRVWTDLCVRKALMQLETILCEFGRICVTGNALMLLETILCEFGQICATESLLQLETILCEFGQICAKGNAPT